MTSPPSRGLVHEGLLYHGCADYLAGAVPFVRAGLAADEPVLVVVPRPRVELISRELGADAARVRFADMTKVGRNPHRIIPDVLRAFVDEFAGRPVRVIGEPIWPGRRAEEIPVCLQHEALINVALAETPATVLCAYDANALPGEVLRQAGRTHPVLVEDGERRPHRGYADPHALVALLNVPLPEPAGPIAEASFDATGLAGLRDLVGEHGRRAGLSPERVADLALAVNEVAAEVLAGSDEPGVLRVWREGLRVVCEVRGPAGAIVGPGAPGLLCANRLCDLVQTHLGPDSVTVRLQLVV